MPTHVPSSDTIYPVMSPQIRWRLFENGASRCPDARRVSHKPVDRLPASTEADPSSKRCRSTTILKFATLSNIVRVSRTGSAPRPRKMKSIACWVERSRRRDNASGMLFCRRCKGDGTRNKSWLISSSTSWGKFQQNWNKVMDATDGRTFEHKRLIQTVMTLPMANLEEELSRRHAAIAQ